jgi:sterol desaturase/sphingolipid hydroxylase (fatty acid hydroxylase superfamily)
MENFESFARALSFALALGIFTVLEHIFPKRRLIDSKNRRWFENITMTVFNTFIIRIVAFAIPFLPAFLAISVEASQIGLLYTVPMPQILRIILAIIILDFIVYVQHVVFHSLPFLWRFHMMHHSDLDFDLTTALRFHPVEIIISLFIKIGAVYLIGAPFYSVVLFEIILNVAAMFNHSNLALHPLVDKILRFVIVTPDMHRVHHSVRINETNSNFGFNFPYWDRLFGTYKAQPAAGHTAMTIGLSHNRSVGKINFLRLLIMPFTEDSGSYSLGHFPEKREVKSEKKSVSKTVKRKKR